MTFKDFIQKLFSAMSAGANTDRFTKTIFEAILSNESPDILNDYKPSSYKGFYNGNTSIKNLSKKINAYIEPEEFSAYIYSYSDAVTANLCEVFADDIPEINIQNVGDKLAELFVSIITEAAGTTKKSTPKDASNQNAVTDNAQDVANPFQRYLERARSYCSTKKTLLYAEKPHPFYEMYVCNTICRALHFIDNNEKDEQVIISDASIAKLESVSKYIIIQGTGGIGKSMFLTHLFLSSEGEPYTPILILLKGYDDTHLKMVDFIVNSTREYDPDISRQDIVTALKEKRLVLLLDGLDEIKSSFKDTFNKELESLIKSYPGNTIIMTSRPVSSFVAYSKFTLFDLLPLNKEQSIELVQKLEFWDATSKINFLEDLDKKLYYSHREFASNPLLLTIMLMTYSSYGEVPAKMHVFYAKAYDTMARLHDASKGSFKRPLHTGLTPEEFAKYFAQFCARTYIKETLDFDFMSFDFYMGKVLKKSTISSRDFLLDLTENLCIMYQEGEHYYFIHRSFQEYFAAVYFASEYDENLYKVAKRFELFTSIYYADKTFEMMYDMIPEKVERFIFLPYLRDLFSECAKESGSEYWSFLDNIYPFLYYEKGITNDSPINESISFIYRKIVEIHGLEEVSALYHYQWPDQIEDLHVQNWVRVYNAFTDYEAFDKYPNPNSIPEELFEQTVIAREGDYPSMYEIYFGTPDVLGFTVEIEIYELRKYPEKYPFLRADMERDTFPLMIEYKAVKDYFNKLEAHTRAEQESKDLFDD